MTGRLRIVAVMMAVVGTALVRCANQTPATVWKVRTRMSETLALPRSAVLWAGPVALWGVEDIPYSRELAPMAGHYPALPLGAPRWLFDSPVGMGRYLDAVMETVGLYGTAGFNDDPRAFASIPSRHDVWRRVTRARLVGMASTGIVDEEDVSEMAHGFAHGFAHGLARKAYGLEREPVGGTAGRPCRATGSRAACWRPGSHSRAGLPSSPGRPGFSGARGLARAGARIGVLGGRSERAQEVAREISAAVGGEAVALPADALDESTPIGPGRGARPVGPPGRPRQRRGR